MKSFSTFHDVIIAPLISEKSMLGISDLKYRFKVKKDACKVEIRQAVEKVFNVKVSKVNTLIVRGKHRRRGRISGMTPSWKKAVVTLAKGEKSIEFFNQIT
jgi:large subunit ribosomal protein L23